MNLSLTSLTLALPALALVLGLIGVTGRIARWSGLPAWTAQRRPGASRLQIVETLRLDPKRKLLLLACDGREALVMAGGGQDVLVGWLPAANERA